MLISSEVASEQKQIRSIIFQSLLAVQCRNQNKKKANFVIIMRKKEVKKAGRKKK